MTAVSYCFLAFSFSFNTPTYTRPSISLIDRKIIEKTTTSVGKGIQCVLLHAEVGDESRLGKLHLKEDFLGAVGLVEGFGRHDSVSETRGHCAVHRHTVHLHLEPLKQSVIIMVVIINADVN